MNLFILPLDFLKFYCNVFSLLLISHVHTKNVLNKFSCDFGHNLTFENANSSRSVLFCVYEAFCAICVHIKKILWFSDSSEQYYFVTPLQWWSMLTLKQQWTRSFYLLISWNSNIFQLCLISRVKTKIV